MNANNDNKSGYKYLLSDKCFLYEEWRKNLTYSSYRVITTIRKEWLLLLDRIQKRQIEDLRQKGVGYKTIAAELNLSRDVVRNYCKAAGMDGYGKDYVDKQYCKYCHKELKQPKTGRKKKFCSATCKVEWEKLHPTLYSHVCQYCGKGFQSLASKAKYCCRECYVHDRFWKKEDLTRILGELENGKIPELIPLWIQEVIAKDYLNRK